MDNRIPGEVFFHACLQVKYGFRRQHQPIHYSIYILVVVYIQESVQGHGNLWKSQVVHQKDQWINGCCQDVSWGPCQHCPLQGFNLNMYWEICKCFESSRIWIFQVCTICVHICKIPAIFLATHIEVMFSHHICQRAHRSSLHGCFETCFKGTRSAHVWSHELCDGRYVSFFLKVGFMCKVGGMLLGCPVGS